MKKWFTLALGPLISIAIIYALVGQDISAVRDELSKAHYLYLLPTALLLILSLGARSVRWHILLDGKVSLTHSFHILNIGYFLSGILPFRAGDIARAWMTTRLSPPVPAFRTLSTLVVERLLDLLSLVALIGLMLVLLDVPVEVTSAGIVIGVAALAGGIVLVVLSSHPQWAFKLLEKFSHWFPWLKRLDLEARLQHFVDGIQPMSSLRVASGALVWTGIAWSFSLAAGYALLFILFDTPTLAAAASLVVLATLSVALPAVPGNLGPFEGAVVGGLWIGDMIASVSPPDNAPAVAVGVVLHALTLGIYVTFGLIGLAAEQASIRQVTDGAQKLAHEAADQEISDPQPAPRTIAPESVS